MLVWASILFSAAILGATFQYFGFPAPWLLGPMLTGLAFGCSPLTTPRVPKIPFMCAQAVVGIVLAGAIHPELLGVLATHWWLMLLVLLATICISMFGAWVLTASRTLDPITAMLGLMPAGANIMTLVALDLDVDARVVAFMQYMRITLVVTTVSLVAHFLFRIQWSAPPAVSRPASLETIALTLSVAAVTAAIGLVARIPGGPVMGPLVLGSILSLAGIIHIGLPVWLLDISYATMGLFIGLGFTIHSVLYVMRIMPRLLATNVGIIVACALVGEVLVRTLHIDPLTAYLSTTPGGIDTMTVIALGGGADVATIVALQATRTFLVTPLGPWATRLVSSRAYSAAPSSS